VRCSSFSFDSVLIQFLTQSICYLCKAIIAFDEVSHLPPYWLAFKDTSNPRFVLQRTLPWPFRTQLLRETGLLAYQADDPREVSPAVRNARWSSLCEALDYWRELTTDRQCRLALLLHALCFYPLISKLIPKNFNKELAADPNRAELAYRGASARYMHEFPSYNADYSNADLSELEEVVNIAPRDHVVTFNGSLKILVHKAKTDAPTVELVEGRVRSEKALEAVLPKQDDFTRALLISRFYRAAAFVPQRQSDRAEVVRMMDLAEQHALAVVPTGPAQEILQLENLYPVIESRTKEALWLGDMDLALAQAERLIDLDRYDSRAWLELGEVRLKRNERAHAAQAYAAAAILGPPSTAIGRHMAGLCFRDLGQPLLAAYFFQAAIESDSRAISPHDEIQRLPELPVLAALKEWSLGSFEP
jgi:tetratricopeptide (TPR) repeat protein